MPVSATFTTPPFSRRAALAAASALTLGLATASTRRARAKGSPVPAAPAAEGDMAAINGVQLYCEVHGDAAGPPVFLLHGGLGNTEEEERLAEFDALYKVAPNFSEEDLKRITVPMLILDGAEDEFVNADQPTRMAEPIPGAELIIMLDTGHFAPFAKTKEFNQIVLDFLDA